jgi:hypothetical protein
MTEQMRPDPFLARNWTKTRVLECLEKKQRFEIARFLDDRYRERFFDPIRCLKNAQANEVGYGFAIMSLCCLLIETIESYRLGLPSTSERDMKALAKLPVNKASGEYSLQGPYRDCSAEAFEKFFECGNHRKYFPDVSGKIFYQNIRCGLLHQAQTKGGWLLARTGEYWDEGPPGSINRDEFTDRLEACFREYLRDLAAEQDWDSDIWKAVRKKVFWLAHSS